MPLLPTLVGGVEFRVRSPRHHGEPVYKRLDFVRTKNDKEDYQLVKTIYPKGRIQRVVEKERKQIEAPPKPPRLTAQQWQHAQQEQHRQQQIRQQQHEQALREQQLREFQMRQFQMNQQRWQHQQQQQHQHQHPQHQFPPPPPPAPPHHGHMHPGQQHAHIHFNPPRMLGNQQPTTFADIVELNSSDESEEEAIVHEIRPKKKSQRGHSRPRSVVVVQDVYSSSEDEDGEQRHRSRSRHRRQASEAGAWHRGAYHR